MKNELKKLKLMGLKELTNFENKLTELDKINVIYSDIRYSLLIKEVCLLKLPRIKKEKFLYSASHIRRFVNMYKANVELYQLETTNLYSIESFNSLFTLKTECEIYNYLIDIFENYNVINSNEKIVIANILTLLNKLNIKCTIHINFLENYICTIEDKITREIFEYAFLQNNKLIEISTRINIGTYQNIQYYIKRQIESNSL